MADWVDRAQAREERHRELALNIQLANAKPVGPSLPLCIDCDSDIPAKRQALGGVSRCVPCQSIFERRSKR